MQTTVKDTYISMQSRMMYIAFFFLSILSIVLMALESFSMTGDRPVVDQLIIVCSLFLGVMFSMVAMLIVEIVYQDEIDQFAFISYLARLTPEFTPLQRYVFLSLIFKRQITSTVSLMVFWIIFGGTARAMAIVFTMTIISMFTLYGTHHVKSAALAMPSQSTEPTDNSTQN